MKKLVAALILTAALSALATAQASADRTAAPTQARCGDGITMCKQ